ncbi:Putative ca2+ sensor ef-hand superfamily [Gryllus bimaculatus]|nr:Putative ca2+ sensor ef-hand superfamily [Gryllus bimaculatus]
MRPAYDTADGARGPSPAATSAPSAQRPRPSAQRPGPGKRWPLHLGTRLPLRHLAPLALRHTPRPAARSLHAHTPGRASPSHCHGPAPAPPRPRPCFAPPRPGFPPVSPHRPAPPLSRPLATPPLTRLAKPGSSPAKHAPHSTHTPTRRPPRPPPPAPATPSPYPAFIFFPRATRCLGTAVKLRVKIEIGGFYVPVRAPSSVKPKQHRFISFHNISTLHRRVHCESAAHLASQNAIPMRPRGAERRAGPVIPQQRGRVSRPALNRQRNGESRVRKKDIRARCCAPHASRFAAKVSALYSRAPRPVARWAGRRAPPTVGDKRSDAGRNNVSYARWYANFTDIDRTITRSVPLLAPRLFYPARSGGRAHRGRRARRGARRARRITDGSAGARESSRVESAACAASPIDPPRERPRARRGRQACLRVPFALRDGPSLPRLASEDPRGEYLRCLRRVIRCQQSDAGSAHETDILMFNVEEELDEFNIHVARHRPEELAKLAKTTKFTRKEIQLIYRGFKQECPTGMVDEDSFKNIFSQFFPQGDASQYAHYVFNTIKHNHTGKISFEDFLGILSKVSRGSVQEKLQWIFGLYDLNGDGLITKNEMLDVVTVVFRE